MNDKLRNESTDRLAEAILSMKNKEEVYAMSEDLFTVAEVKSLAQRLDVAIMLSEKNPYTEIVAKTGVSTATISRVNRCLLYGADGYNIILDRIKKEK
jgi:TrpR-related protein YerC/YecD